MKIIALEEHVETPLYVSKVVSGPRRAATLADRSRNVGHDVGAELANIGESRIK